MSAGAGDGEHLILEQTLNREDGVDVVGPVTALAAIRTLRIEEFGELLLPIAQGMDLHSRDLRGYADANCFFGPRALLRRHVLMNSLPLVVTRELSDAVGQI